ncbi:2-hydroxyacid dehydrogenase [Rhizobium helianthi]|uniref:2-hydroxyacid dehydrogenase n=1 Tax=Rhizobium helianthi TaxID=1132695 RepID=A0ABW4M225_9HYPH
MPKPIAFVCRLDREEEQQWLEVLREKLPQETILPFRQISPDERRMIEVAIVANPDPTEVAALPGLAWIHSLWAGVERLVAELGTSSPPIVRLVDPELARVMAEAVLAWTYYLHRDMPAYRQQQACSQWKQRAYRHPSSLQVGMLGLGELGKASATRLSSAGFRIKGWSASPKQLDGVSTSTGEDGLMDLLSTSDIVVCLLPLTRETRYLLNERRLSSMPKGSSLINFARGAIVENEALLRLLDERHLDHAVLDVFEQEPLPDASPLWAHPQITVLPHISAPTTPDTAASIVAANIAEWRSSGRLPKTVALTRGY